MVPSLFLVERDLIAAMGLLTYNYLHFDAPLVKGNVTTHVRGYNVHSLVVDNTDGEVLAIAQNEIFQDESPFEHAEQVAVRAALERLKQKVSRPLGVSVDVYYKKHLFMAPGVEEQDFAVKGCTLYNTFDPCGFCAVTLLIGYMKRIAYLFEDAKFAAVYDYMKQNYFSGRDSKKEPVHTISPAQDDGTWHVRASVLLQSLRRKVEEIKAAGTPLVMTLDACFEDLREAARLFGELEPGLLLTEGKERVCNEQTLQDLRRACGGI